MEGREEIFECSLYDPRTGQTNEHDLSLPDTLRILTDRQPPTPLRMAANVGGKRSTEMNASLSRYLSDCFHRPTLWVPNFRELLGVDWSL